MKNAEREILEMVPGITVIDAEFDRRLDDEDLLEVMAEWEGLPDVATLKATYSRYELTVMQLAFVGAPMQL